MKKSGIFIAVFLFIVCSVSAVQAWPDGQRQGLLLGITGGIGNMEMEFKDNSYDDTCYMAGLYIGAGLTEQFLLSFRYRYHNAEINDITYHTFMWTGDLMFFPVPDMGLFLNAGIGRALVDPDAANAQSKSGVVFYGGIGYEITKWVFLEVDYSRADLEDDITGSTILFSISIIGY